MQLFEIHDLKTLAARLQDPQPLAGVVCQDMDLRGLVAPLRARSLAGAAFLGCELGEAEHHAIATGALVFPHIDGLPYEPYRAQLYSQGELLEGYTPGRGSFWTDSRDSKIYHHYRGFRDRGHTPVLEALAQRLHDHAIDEALGDLLVAHPKVAAIMGGHSMKRDEPSFRAVAEIARALTRAGVFMATGGGPGAMEAGNLGAWLAPHPDEALDEAVATLSGCVDYHQDAYLERGIDVCRRFPEGAESLAIPTWFYGHEPTNAFASHIGKYFANSLREDGLLAIATQGVVYAPGSAGTVQEVFMDACQNHYGTFKVVSPMVFFGVDFWTRELPVVPLLKRLAGSRQYAELISVTDDVSEVVARIRDAEPPEFR